jgi:SOS-response transcriptional repressor LexA
MNQLYKTASEREQEILDAISDFRDKHGYSPSYSQLSTLTGLSKGRVAQIINALEDKRLITKDGSKARTLQVINN